MEPLEGIRISLWLKNNGDYICFKLVNTCYAMQETLFRVIHLLRKRLQFVS